MPAANKQFSERELMVEKIQNDQFIAIFHILRQ